jgi:hypothetical protein
MEMKPTEPAFKLLNRSQSIADAKPLIERASPLLREIVNYSTNVFMRCMHAGNSGSKDLPAFTLYLHMIEMTDGIEVLMSQACCEPAVPLLRSSFEASMSLRYMLQEDYENRSLKSGDTTPISPSSSSLGGIPGTQYPFLPPPPLGGVLPQMTTTTERL